MPTFAYEAMNASGKAQKGTMEAGSSDEVIQKLRGEGMFPTSVREAKAAAKETAKRAAPAAKPAPKAAESASSKPVTGAKPKRSALDNRSSEDLEAAIAKFTARRTQIDEELASPALARDRTKLDKLVKEREKLESDLAAHEEAWLRKAEAG